MRKDTVTAANKQLPKKSLFNCNQMPPESLLKSHKSGAGLNCTPRQTTTAPERNDQETPFTRRTMAVCTHTGQRRNKRVQELTVSVQQEKSLFIIVFI